MDIWEK
jgi:hypothetical protein